uniref:C-type lectin domain-containing protein n=1 Tax=Latimeria chalumnae TaxID=7897 RepID=H3A8U5_LATCH
VDMEAFFQLLLFFAVASVISQHVILQYHFVELEKTWGEAQNYCRAHYQDLISIHSAQQMETIRSISGVSNEEAVWIGLRRNAGVRQWLWSNGDPVNTSMSDINQINHESKNKKNCVVIKTKNKWQGEDCSKVNCFICMKENKTSGQREYHISSEERSWFEALEICRRDYTDLTSIHSPEQLQEIQSKIGNNDVWIGLYRDEWLWSNGKPALFQDWGQGEPNNGGNNENCAGLWFDNNRDGKWINFPCSCSFPFLCYQDQSKYILVKENKTWIEALNYCRTNHTDLASIPNATAQTEIAELAKTSSGGGGVWIGLRRDRLLGFWFWMDDDESEFSNWGDGSKGDLFSDHCGMIDKEENFTWRFECCSTKLNFICY